MAAYRVEFRPRALRSLTALAKEAQEKLVAKAEALAKNPFPAGVKKMSGREGLYRVRVGDYRLVYEVRKTVLLVLVAAVGHRREIYRKL